MTKQDIIIRTYQIIMPNSRNKSQLLGVAKSQISKINPKEICYDPQKNRYFQATKDMRDIIQYIREATTNFLSRRTNKSNLRIADIDNYMDSFYEKNGLLPSSEFRIMRDNNGNICGGFSSNINKDELYVSSFYLDKDSQKRGVIRELFEDIKNRAMEFNCKKVTIDVIGENELKRSERLGFKEQKTSFLETLLDWNLINKYILKNKKASCSVDEFGKNWLE